MEKECSLYKKEKANKVRCIACSHRCLIAENKTGICGVRKNIKGRLYLMVYGKLVAQHVDPVEKKPLYHFFPGSKAYSIGTIGCNFQCGFCQNFDISQVRNIIGLGTTPEEIVREAIKNKCESIAYTYNEPTIYIEFVRDIARIAKKKGLKNILVTNGYQTPECISFLAPYIDAMNIDLKSFSDKFYIKNCKARLNPVLEAIKLAYKKRIWIEITTLLIPRENDSEKEMAQIAKFISSVGKDVPWHISRFFPTYKMAEKEPTGISSLMKAYEIGRKCLNYVYIGNVPQENVTRCPKCKKPVITRTGYLTESMLAGSKCPNCKTKIAGVFK